MNNAGNNVSLIIGQADSVASVKIDDKQQTFLRVPADSPPNK